MQTANEKSLGQAAALVATIALLFQAGLRAENTIRQAYEFSARGMTREAEQIWRQLESGFAGRDELREVYFGRASNLLNIQPKSSANVETAAKLYRDVAKGNPNDEIGVASAYFLIRIDQFHRGPNPDLDRIAADFLALNALHPDRYFGQLALLKHVTISLWSDPASKPNVNGILRLESHAKDFTRPELAVIYHFLMSDAYLVRFSDPIAALRHQLARGGRLMVKEDTSADLTLKTAELCRETGDLREAAAYYREFLRLFPTNGRAWLVRERLDELGAKTK